VVEALGGFDPRATYDDASRDYEDASRQFWQYLSTRTVDRLGLRAGERVLDVPCGTGASLLAISALVGPTGRVIGLDYADQMVAIARDKIRASGVTNVEVGVGDMTVIEPPRERFDAVVCVLGVFFVDDMSALVRSFMELVRRGGGRVAVSVFGEHFFDPMRDVFVGAVGEVAAGVDVVEPWRRVDAEDALRAVFQEAGVDDVRIETDEDRIALASPDDWWRIVMGSGLRATVARIGKPAAARVRARCDEYVRDHHVTELVTRSRYAIAVRV
jgi:SAM-dependent methyltransferase